MLTGVREWVRRIGLVSYDAVAIRDGNKIPRFGQFAWDLVGPSYVHPLVAFHDGKPLPGFIVADVLISDEEVTLDGVAYFLSKVQMMRSQKNTRPFLSLFVSNRFAQDAWAAGRRNGLVFASLETLLGTQVAEALNALIQTLKNAGAAISKDPDIVYKIFSGLSKIEGAAGNLRGPLFEMIVAHCVKSLEGGSIDIGKVVTDPSSGNDVEIDVLLVGNSRKINAYECKGIAPDKLIYRQDIEDWLRKTIPRTRNWILKARRDLGNRELTFAFWTSGRFHPEARILLDKRKNQITKYALSYKDGAAVFEYAKRQTSQRILDVLREQYLLSFPLGDESA